MPFITSPSIVQIQNAVGAVVVPVARILKFTGAIVVTQVGTGLAEIDGTGVGGGAWDVVGNAGAGLKLGTSTASAWDMIVNNVVVGGFDATGKFLVGSKNILSLTALPTGGGGVAAAIGSLAMVNVAGVASLYQKTGAGSTAWTSVTGGGGGVPVGTANSVPYYDAGAVFASTDPNFQFDGAGTSLKFGRATSGGAIETFGTNPGATGGLAFGLADGALSLIRAYTASGNNEAGVAFGIAQGGGVIQSSGGGAMAFGFCGAGGGPGGPGIYATQASLAFGYSQNGGSGILSSGGSLAYGVTDNGRIQSVGVGSFAGGESDGNGQIVATGGAAPAFAWGRAGNGVASQINVTDGGVVFAVVTTGAHLDVGGPGTFATGNFSQHTTNSLNAFGSFLGGTDVEGDPSIVTGSGAINYGASSNLSANYGQAFGYGLINQSFSSMHIGRFSVAAGLYSGWVDTDPLFVAGNGADGANRNNAFQIDKDGRVKTTAAHIDKIRVIVGTDTLSARTDYKAICDAGAGAFDLNLPPGEDGLNFIIGQSAANIGVFTIMPDGVDVLDANIQNIFDTNQPVPITFKSGTWYAI